MRFEFRTTAVALASCALLVGGCGGSSDNDTAKNVSVNGSELDIDAVIAAAEKDKVSKVAVTIDAKGIGLRKPLSLKGTGISSLTTVGIDLTLDAKPIAEATGIPATTLPAQLRFILTPDKGALETPPAFRAQIPGQKKWIGLDFRKISAETIAGLRNLLRLDVKSSLAPFRKNALEKAGTESINGVQTTRWKGTISNEDIVATLPKDRREATRKALTSDEAGKRDFKRKFPVEFWIDDSGRMHRSVSSVTASATPGPAATPGGTLTIRIDATEFGKGEVPALPPADETWDATNNAGALLSSGDAS